MAYVKYIIFALGSQKYGMRLVRVSGLEPLNVTIPIPVDIPNIEGVINLRGALVPIYDMKAQLNIAKTQRTETSQMIVAESHGLKLGFEVDNVLGIVLISEEDTKLLPKVVTNDETDIVESVIKVLLPESRKEELMLSINVDALMTDAEFEKLKEVIRETEKANQAEEESEEDTESEENDSDEPEEDETEMSAEDESVSDSDE